MAKDTEAVVVNEGATYEAKNEDSQGDKARVVAFFVDRPRNTVKFAPLGSGREDSMSIDEFLNAYTLIAQAGEPLPENKAENDKAQKAATAQTEEARKTPQRAERMDTTTITPTRSGLEDRANARNER
jgi:hypothetical protein